MFTGIKHLHLLLVLLFVLTTLIKTILLFVNSGKFESYRAKTRIPEIIITILFLITGIALLTIKGSGFHTVFWVKLTVILVAIPLSIIGFKKQAKIPALLGAFLFIMVYGLAEMAAKKAVITTVEVESEQQGTVAHGTELYKLNCVVCHGENGNKNLGGASDLALSSLTEKQIIEIVSKGTKKMPAFNTLNEEELKAISLYLIELQK
ncbi:MAG: mono/diheme cytochrome c family protein [Saprospiraceae bacterium]|jgi:mono/diheme cytochrome c family protein